MPAVYRGTREIPLAELTPFPGNARRGDVPVIAESLAVNGQYRSTVVRDTGGALVILAGNHTTQAVRFLASLSPEALQDRYGAKLRAAAEQADAAAAAAQTAAAGATPGTETAEDAAAAAETATQAAAAARSALATLTSWSGRTTVRCEVIECDDAEARRINLADNRTAEIGSYDDEALAELLAGLDGDYTGSGWAEDDVSALLSGDHDGLGGGGPGISGGPDDLPEVPADPVTRLGDLYWLGPHRILCGDSTNPAQVARLVAGETVTMIHADPPYGMGKEADGVLNDNLYGPKLDAFQMAWWAAWLPVLAENGSAYIWGNAPDLWRLWYAGGLGAEDCGLMARNEIVWDKKSAPGMATEIRHSYTTASERCLFLMRGVQFLGNQNKDDYWDGYEPLRVWLVAERDRAGWSNKDVNDLTGTYMAGHWFSQSQFAPISPKHYRVLAEAAAGRAFTRDYRELFEELFPSVRAGGDEHRRDLAASLRDLRTCFDNTHASMTDVWDFPRVAGDDRYGHATPKPVAMVERAVKSSSQPGDLVGVPFAGTGPEFIAAHLLERRAVAMELEPRYVDVIIKRWENATGEKAVREDGRLWSECAA